MFKKLAIIFISAISACSIFAQDDMKLNFRGEIYENTCDLYQVSAEEKCAVLENQWFQLHNRIIDPKLSAEEIQAYVQNFSEVHSTFYGASLKSVNENQAFNIEIHYK